jgi:type I restriction enzyme, S subunit
MNWPTQPLFSLGTVQTGSTPSTSKETFWGGEIPFVTPSELDQSIPITITPRTLSDEGGREARLLGEGTVLICCIGSLGKIGIAGRTLATNQQINSVEFDPQRIWPRFGYYACQELKTKLLTMAPATTVPIVNKSKFEQLEIPVPPLPEQRRIAAILDQADALRAKRREALAQLDSLTQSIFVEMFGDPMTQSNQWKSQPISNFVIGFESGKSVAAEDENDSASYFRVLKVSAVTSLEYKPQESKAAPIVFTPKQSYFVRKGDLLFSRANTTDLIGATAYVSYTPPNLLLSDKLWRFVWHEIPRAEPLFVNYLFRQPRFRAEIGRRASGTSGSMKNISQDKVLSITVGFPPIKLQRTFANRVRCIEQTKIACRASEVELDTLFASLQHRAFRGEL